MRACRSRVTHPSAGRRQLVLLPVALPLDLHVLSLPLAFILSQDQTLLCIMSKFLASWHPFHSCVSGGHHCPARHGIDALEFLFFGTCCTVSPVLSMIFSCPSGNPSQSLSDPHFPNGIAKVHLFSFPPNFFATFFSSFFCPRRPRNTQTPVNHRIPQKSFFRQNRMTFLLFLHRIGIDSVLARDTI